MVETKKTRTIYFDMDGVLARWDDKATPEEVAAPGYFRKREPQQNLIQAALRLKSEGYDVRILSSVYQDGHSADDKAAWLEANGMSKIERVFIPYGTPKGSHIPDEEHAILVDDFTDNLIGSLDGSLPAFRGTPVKFYNQVNGTKGRFAATKGYRLSEESTVNAIAFLLKVLAEN